MEEDNKLLEIKGYEVHPPGQYSLEAMERVTHLVEYEGPILSLFRLKSNGSYFLVYWVDWDKDCNRWMIWEVQKEVLQRFLDGEITAQETVGEAVTILDIGDHENDPLKLNYLREWSVMQADIPEDYFPEKEWKCDFQYALSNE